MTGREALDLVNGILTSIQQDPITVLPLNGTEKENVAAVLRAYIARLRKSQPRYSDIPDEMLPDMIVQRLREELKKMK